MLSPTGPVAVVCNGTRTGTEDGAGGTLFGGAWDARARFGGDGLPLTISVGSS
ncbi:MAG: hypothetical protein GY811_16490 [Myxococcales bacterium]|nr:hypothetical protein [Myxococcales bacterium]